MDTKRQMLEAALADARATRERRFTRYYGLLVRLPWGKGSVAEGTHEIVDDDGEMVALEEESMRRCHERGEDPNDGRVGVVFEDPVGAVVAHPIRTADGRRRTWKAVYWWNGVVGKTVNLVPHTDDGRVMLVPAWRGPVVCRWELEFPGGGDIHAKQEEQAVRTELFEECGYEVLSCRRLGGEELFIVDPSTNGTPQSVWAVRLGEKVGQRPEDGEIFREPVLLDRQELVDALQCGYHTLAHGRRYAVLNGRNGICAAMAFAYGLVR